MIASGVNTICMIFTLNGFHDFIKILMQLWLAYLYKTDIWMPFVYLKRKKSEYKVKGQCYNIYKLVQRYKLQGVWNIHFTVEKNLV